MKEIKSIEAKKIFTQFLFSRVFLAGWKKSSVDDIRLDGSGKLLLYLYLITTNLFRFTVWYMMRRVRFHWIRLLKSCTQLLLTFSVASWLMLKMRMRNSCSVWHHRVRLYISSNLQKLSVFKQFLIQWHSHIWYHMRITHMRDVKFASRFFNWRVEDALDVLFTLMLWYWSPSLILIQYINHWIAKTSGNLYYGIRGSQWAM